MKLTFHLMVSMRKGDKESKNSIHRKEMAKKPITE